MVEKNAFIAYFQPFELLFMDETTVSLHPLLRRCWMKRGQRKRVPAPGSPHHCHVFGAYNWRNGHVSWQIAQRKNSETFLAFVEHLLLNEYPTQHLVLVMDNASYHHSRTAQAAFSLFEDRLLVIWLPKYSPFLNPIERLWLHLKNLACANFLYTGMDELMAALQRTLANQNILHHPERLAFATYFRLPA